jgi:hypothetical protein
MKGLFAIVEVCSACKDNILSATLSSAYEVYGFYEKAVSLSPQPDAGITRGLASGSSQNKKGRFCSDRVLFMASQHKNVRFLC